MRLTLAAALLMTIVGCTQTPPTTPTTDNGGAAIKAGAKQHAECLVCKHENDLACVDIVVDKDTPRTTVNGKEYYFCSDDCCKEFKAAPAKFTNQK